MSERIWGAQLETATMNTTKTTINRIDHLFENFENFENFEIPESSQPAREFAPFLRARQTDSQSGTMPGPRDDDLDRFVAGIDEAGRGPVLGSMVYAIAWCRRSFEATLKSEGFADSKQLTPEKRSELMRYLEANRTRCVTGDLMDGGVDYASESLSARQISGRMLDSTRSSLNEIAFESTCRIIEEMLRKLARSASVRSEDATACVDTVYVDTLGNPERHKDRLSRKFPGLSFVVESKADQTYPVVSAASIVAKVQRDTELEALASGAVSGSSGSCEVGSGYPGDERTKKWLQSQVDPIFGFPPLVRFSWQTCRTILKESRAVEVSWDCEEEDQDKTQQKLWSTCQPSGPTKRSAESSSTGRHSFFRSRKLQKIGVF